MWSGPRNISTAMMYFFHHRGDCHVVDEPFYSYYLKVSGSKHPGRKEIMSTQEQDKSEIIHNLLTKEYAEPILFMKSMPHQMVGVELNFVKNFHNFFLIREPREMLLSYIQKRPEPIMQDFGLDIQYQLFMDLQENGHSPIVIDSFELLSNPAGVISDLCSKLRIPFEERMLHWPAGAIAQEGVWAKYWYANVHASTGFGQATKKDVSSLPASIEDLAQECEHYYREMKKYTWTE